MAVWEITDSQVTKLEGFELSWLYTEAYKYVTPRLSTTPSGKEEVSLEAGPFVGTLPLKNEDTLYIVPRAGRRSFTRMLLLAEGLRDAVRKEFEETAQLGVDEGSSMSWAELLANSFMDRLRFIEKQSLLFSRQKESYQGSYARGKIDVLPTLRSLQKQDWTIHGVVRTRTYQIIEHRLLASAVAVLSQLNLIAPGYNELASRWLSFLKGNLITTSELVEVVSGLQARRYTGARAYYIPALLMARLILAQAGISLDSTRSIDAAPLLTNMPLLFEKYVRAVIAEKFRDLLVEKRTTQTLSLFLDGTCKLEPDVLISDARGVRLVLDVKYKPRYTISPADYYQITAYLRAFQTNKGMILLPSQNEDETRLERRQLPSGELIFELFVPLGNWEGAEDAIERGLADALSS